MRVIDVSNNQGTIDWYRVSRVGKVARWRKIYGAYLKASEGRTYRDNRYKDYKEGATHAGIATGAYHFARPDHNNPESEAENFLHAISGQVRKGDLLPVLDLEVSGSVGAASASLWARRFNKAVHKAVGVWPLFYSYPYFISSMDPSYPIGGGLWIASYGRNDGFRHSVTIPSPWKTCKMHQFTSQGSVDGIRGHVDLNYIKDINSIKRR